MDKIKKIRAEIERLKEEVGFGLSEYDQGYENGRGEAYNKILAFIDSLQEQEQKELEGFAPGTNNPEIAGRDFVPVEWVETLEKYDKWKIVKVEQEPQGLDEAAYRYSFESRPSVYGQVDVIDAFKAGANWGAEHLKK